MLDLMRTCARARPLDVAIGEDDGHSVVLTLMVPARSDSCPLSARGGGVKVAAGVLAAARPARGTLTRPSTPVRWRVGASAVTVAQYGLRSSGSGRRHAIAHVRSPTANWCEGGATSPQGTNVDRSWIDGFDGRGRRSPLVSRSEGRPRAIAAAVDFVDETAKNRGQRGVCEKGHRRNWTLSPRCPALEWSVVVVRRIQGGRDEPEPARGSDAAAGADTDRELGHDFRAKRASLPLAH